MRKEFGPERRIVMQFRSPRDVRGVAVLIFDLPPESSRADEYWLYLPALRRDPSAVPNASRGREFIDTGLTFDDIRNEPSISVEDYSWEVGGEETIEGRHSYQVEAHAVDDRVADELGYSRVIYSVDPQAGLIVQAQFRDRKGNLVKTMRRSEVRLVQGILTAHRVSIENHKTGSVTHWMSREIDYRSPLDDELFTKSASWIVIPRAVHAEELAVTKVERRTDSRIVSSSKDSEILVVHLAVRVPDEEDVLPLQRSDIEFQDLEGHSYPCLTGNAMLSGQAVEIPFQVPMGVRPKSLRVDRLQIDISGLEALPPP